VIGLACALALTASVAALGAATTAQAGCVPIPHDDYYCSITAPHPTPGGSPPVIPPGH
jgi:hypothetical protein